MTTLGSFGDELVAAELRRRQRQQRLRNRSALVVTVFAVLAAVSGLTVLLWPTPASAAVEVRRAPGAVIVKLVDLAARPDEVEAELQNAGLDIDIVDVPASPSMVGRFINTAGSGPLPAILRVVEGEAEAFSGFSLPADWNGSLELRLGRPAEAGESYVREVNAFAAGEVLACAGWRDLDAAAALERAWDYDFVFSWRQRAANGTERVLSPGQLRQRPWSHLHVGDVRATQPGVVVVELVDPDAPAPRRPLHPPDQAC